MSFLKEQNLIVSEKVHWKSHHPEAGYTKRVRLLDGDIVHTWIEADQDILMDFMDVELLKLVLWESDLVNRQFHIIFDLTNVSNISYNYKREITELLFHWQPFIGVVCFCNACPSMIIMVESFSAVAPENFCVILTETYQSSLKKVLAFKANERVDECMKRDDTVESQGIKQQFLGAIARMSWLNIYDYPIYMPAPDSQYYLFFQAVDGLRIDLKAKAREKEGEIKQIKQDYEYRITQLTIKMNAQAEAGKKSIHDYEAQVAALESRITAQDMELTRIATAISEKTNALRDLLDQIYDLTIDNDIKRAMTDTCLRLLETETIERRLNIELTESDSLFLSKLQKKHPNLNQREMRIGLMVKLNYDTVEIARTVGISTRGMESIRYRMHKKLGLGKHESIKTYLTELSA
ncbi:MAG: transcriptional regulator [Chlorobiaceae bacterium]